MKTMILVGSLLLAMSSFGQSLNKVYDFSLLQIRPCHLDAMGCVPGLKFNGEDILIDSSSAPESLELYRENTDFITLKNQKGIFVMEAGLIGSPMSTTKMKVFKFIEEDSDAQINFCDPRAMGCAISIEVKDKRYILAQETLPSNIRNFSNQTKNLSVSVQGYTIRETGHFPTPTAMIDVFKITKISVNEVSKPKSEVIYDDFRQVDGFEMVPDIVTPKKRVISE